MKILFILSLSLLTSFSHADFISAQKDYSQGNYKKAYDEYLTLAKLGNNKAQYNLAVMYVKGQGVEIDLIKAYSWAKASESNPEYSALTNNIEKGLSKEQLLKAKEIYNKEFTQYTFDKSKVLLGPIVERQVNVDSNKTTDISETVNIVIEKTFPPVYPRKMLINHLEGWVDLSFKILPDGSVRDIYITEEMPANSFAKEAIKAVEKYRFSFEKNNQKTLINEPRFATQRINFKLSHSEVGISKKQQDYLDDLIKKAEEGNIAAQYNYAFLYESYLSKKGKVDGETINQWLFNAAIDGVTDAQYRLGKNIYYGNDCKVEKQKGLDWIMQAAQIGNAQAQYTAYVMLKNKDAINQTELSPFYWLQQAAENGLDIAQLNFAKEIALLDSPTMDQVSTAKEYLSGYSKSIYETTQWHQINAMLLNKTNKRSKALKSVKKALKSAKKLDWDLTELHQLQTEIKNKKS